MRGSIGRHSFDAYERRFPRIIEAAFELMPQGPPWDEREYAEWLTYLDQACRIYYRLPILRPELPPMDPELMGHLG